MTGQDVRLRMRARRIVLVGFSGVGKSTVARRLADSLGWQLLDMDAEIEQREGRSIPEIFRDSGEESFRRLERKVFSEGLQADRVVIATGGGAVVSDDVWTEHMLGVPETLAVLLDAPPDSLFERLRDQQSRDRRGAERPMLAGDNPLARITALKEQRMPWYRRAEVVVPVDGRTVDEVARTIVSAAAPGRTQPITLDVPGSTSLIRVGHGVVDQLGSTIAEKWPRARRAWIGADEQVATFHLERISKEAAASGAEVRAVTFPSGEGSKSMSGLSLIYDALLGQGIERSDVVVALGGGVSGDLVGFAAATVLRGVGLVQVPTSLLAMVDSSVGGKTGINHATGKNLIGAFHQPEHVLIDPALLTTLPDREYRSGWAEIIKHGLIEASTPAGDSGLFQLIRENADSLATSMSPLLSGIIARNVEIKASVVRADERETGLRAILNFGHTLGHAVEAAGYQLLHGEAIAVGLHGAMRLGVETGRISSDYADEVVDLLQRFGLPTAVTAEADRIHQLMQSDKKRVSGEQQWILPNAGGGVSIVRGVSAEAAGAALASILR